MGRDPAGGSKRGEEGQRVTDTKKTRDTREKAKSRSCYEGNNGRKRKERRRPTHTEMGGQTGKRTPGPKHKRGTQKRSKRRENPKHKTTLKFPHRVRVGVSQGQVAASSHQAHNPHTGAGTANGQSARAGGTVQAWDPQGLWPQTPRPAPQHFLPRIQDNGQGRAGSSCIHPARGSGWRMPGYLSLRGREGNPGVCLPEKGETGKAAGRSRPLPEANAMASTALGKVPAWSPGMWVIGCPHPGRRG